ncbi:MAG: hypothetical protein K0S90_3221 [Enterobacteriaceae bacterium]|nr:hypothetical protein [Enterobacteriaceae bacterium]
MRLLPWVAGSIFYDLLQHGREIESAIARHDASLLNHTTPALERYFSRPPSELPRQNPYTVATLFPLFLVAFALNLLPFPEAGGHLLLLFLLFMLAGTCLIAGDLCCLQFIAALSVLSPLRVKCA